jgi:peptidoglycan/LPS O-acetylase OafA/YrhL
MYLDLFVMATLFFISGYFITGSIRRKNTLDYIKSKFKRIMIPWIIAVITLIPAYKAIFLYSRGLPQEEWYSYFHFFQRTGGNPWFYSDNPVQNWLWFLPVLFTFQLLFLALSKIDFSNLKISIRIGVIITAILGVIYGLFISSAGLSGWYHSWIFHFQRERLLIYFMIFLLGALCYRHKVFENTSKNRKRYIIVNVVLMMTLGVFTAVALNIFFNIIEPERNFYFVSEFVDSMLYFTSSMISILGFMYVLIHVFRFNFNKTNGLMNQLNKSSYSVYIIHVIIMGIIAMILVNMNIPAIIKYLILAILTFVVSNLLIYVYQEIFQKSIPLKVASIALFFIAFFSVTNFGNEGNSVVNTKTTSNILTNTEAPSIGLHEAVIAGDINSILQHIKVGSNLNEKESTVGSSPLITASTFGQTEIALALIDGGADVNFINREGSTPLHAAAFFCHTEIVEALIKNGVDKTIRNNAGSTALDSVIGPFEEVKAIYDYFERTFSPMGIKLDKEEIRMTRPLIAELLKDY